MKRDSLPRNERGVWGARRSAATSQGLRVKRDSLPRNERGVWGARRSAPQNREMVGAYVAATIVALVQYLRLKDRRVLLLVALFACQAQALAREWFDFWKDVFQTGACAAGLLLLLAFTLRHGAGGPSVARPPAGRPAPPGV